MSQTKTTLSKTHASPAIFTLAAVLLAISGVGYASGQNEPAALDAENLDLREANVTAVEAQSARTRTFRFDVTLLHDDDGEDGYANWWQVETLEGDQLGRRELLHAHGTREFTRSETIEVPEGIMWVVIRGHDQTHAYGGTAAIYNLDTGDLELVDQGPERADFAEWGPGR